MRQARVQDHQAGGVDLGAALGDPGLHDLRVPSGSPGAISPLGGAAAHELEGALADADPAHAVVDAARAEPLLREREAGALGAERFSTGTRTPVSAPRRGSSSRRPPRP